MTKDRVYFEPLKIDRGSYFVEYYAANELPPLAAIQLIVPEPMPIERVADAMETELVLWLERYPVPVMVSAFDGTGSLISIEGVRPFRHLVGWREPTSGTQVSRWALVAAHEFPAEAWDSESLLRLYHDIPHRTTGQLQANARRQRRTIHITRLLALMWLVAIPAGIAAYEFDGPRWFSVVTLGYAVVMAYIQGLKLLGKWPKTEHDLAKEADELLMRHHHYHCQRNPEGFQRLKRENIERESRESIQLEAAALKKQKSE